MIKIVIFVCFTMFILTSCKASDDKMVVRVGYVGEVYNKVWEEVYKELRKENIIVEAIPFEDYTLLNEALNNNDIDLNVFQNYAYFIYDTNRNNYNFDIAEKTCIPALNMYSSKLKSIDEIHTNAKISIPDDPINISRALKILETIGLIKLKESTSRIYNYVLTDIAENPLSLKILTNRVSKTFSIINIIDAVFITYNLSYDFRNYNIIYQDDPSKYISDMYVNIVAIRKKDMYNSAFRNVASLYKEKLDEKIESGNMHGLIMIY